MKKHTLLAAVSLAPLSSAIRLEHSESPAVFGTTIQRRKDVPKFSKHKSKRQDVQGTVHVDLDNEQTLYFADVAVGDPPQQFRLHVDTGSSDMWVNSDTSQICQYPGDYCSISGTYSANDSSSSEYVNSAFNISYLDGSSATGDYVSDNITIGNLTLPRIQFGVGYNSTSPQGILGLGYRSGTVQVLRAGLRPYDNLPSALVETGAIRTPAYSLWLNDLDASMGSILFGGVDTERYIEPLLTVPIIPQSSFMNGTNSAEYVRLIIAMTALGRNDDPSLNIANDIALGVLLDSGSSITYLPNNLVNALYDAYNVQYSARYSVGIVDCNLADSPDTIDFSFSGARVRVPLNELVLTNGVRRSTGQSVCIFGISPNEGSASILGDTFLRSAYVVYDLAANEISLAQTNFNATNTNVLEIAPPDGGGVPEATEVESPVTSVGALETGPGRISNVGQIEAAGAVVTPAPRVVVGGAVAVGVAVGGALFAL